MEDKLNDEVKNIMEQNEVPSDGYFICFTPTVYVDFKYTTQKLKKELTQAFKNYKVEQTEDLTLA